MDPTSLECTKTPFVPDQLGFPVDIGIAISVSAAGQTENLIVYGCVLDGGQPPCLPELATADVTGFSLVDVGPVLPPPLGVGFPPDLKEDAYGRLFAFDSTGTLLEIDPSNGTLLGEDATGLLSGVGSATGGCLDHVNMGGSHLFFHRKQRCD